ncbi:MAG TPA: glycosyltransferase [Ktedonobacterales bacterium]|jgi:mannosylfructose-phosphate synthase
MLWNDSRGDAILMLSLHGYVSAEPELGKPDTGGQVTYVLEMGKQFAQMGYTVDLVTRQFEDQPECDEVSDRFRVWRIPFGGRDFIRKEDLHDHLDEFVANLIARVQQTGRQYAVVYSHYWDAGWAGQQIADELGLPHVHTPHSLGWWKRTNMALDMDQASMENTYRFKERIRKEFLVYRACQQLIATTDHQTQILQEQYGVLERHITVIPPGLDEQRFSPVRPEIQRELRERYQVQPCDILTVGRMAANKGYDLLLQAMPTVLTLAPEARLIAAIGGEHAHRDDPGIAALKVQAEELGICDHIVWTHYIPDDELVDYYRSAAVFSLSSRYEPFGMVAIEAMACGTPTVVTAHSGLAEVLRFGSQALVADPTRPIEYGSLLALPLLYPRLANELSVEGSRFARRQFSWTGIARRVLATFTRVQVHMEGLAI